MDTPRKTTPTPDEAFRALCDATTRLAAIRVARADQYATLFARIAQGKYLSTHVLSRWSGLGERRLRYLREGEKPRPGEIEILRSLATAIEQDGATLEEASRRILVLEVAHTT